MGLWHKGELLSSSLAGLVHMCLMPPPASGCDKATFQIRSSPASLCLPTTLCRRAGRPAGRAVHPPERENHAVQAPPHPLPVRWCVGQFVVAWLRAWGGQAAARWFGLCQVGGCMGLALQASFVATAMRALSHADRPGAAWQRWSASPLSPPLCGLPWRGAAPAARCPRR